MVTLRSGGPGLPARVLDSLGQDLRLAARGLVRSPGFTLIALLSLALGIGGNAVIFSLVNALLLRPLPVARPAEMVSVFTSDYSGSLYGASSYPDYREFRDQTPALSGLLAYMPAPLGLRAGAQVERVFAEVVSANYFEVIGLPPSAGRGFLPVEDEGVGRHPVVVVSHGLWQRRFGSDPGLVGRSLTLNGQAFEVVGIGPPNHAGLLRGLAVDLWVPLTMLPQLRAGSDELENRGGRGLFLIGRLAPGASIAVAQTQLDLVAERLHQAYPDAWTGLSQRPRTVAVLPESESRVFPEARLPLVGFLGLLQAVVGLVLLIASVNVANLLLARATQRQREIGIRLALGAERGRLLQQLLTESLLLSTLGCGIGLLGALWVTDALTALRLPIPLPVALELRLDVRVVGFALLLSWLTGVLFGLAPALASARAEVLPALREAGPGSGPRRSRLRNALVVGQLAVSLLLLVGAGLFVRSLANAHAIELGFDPEHVALVAADLSLGGYGEARGLELYQEMLDRAAVQPGVTSVSLAQNLPLGFGGGRRGIAIEGYRAQAGEDMEVSFDVVGPRYFETLRVPLLRGRGFTTADAGGATGVVVVNQAFVRRYWPGEDGLGKRLGTAGPDGPMLEVVGVAKDGRYVTLGEEPRPFLFLPLFQQYESTATLVARTAGEPSEVLGVLRARIQSLDPNLPLFEARTLTDHLGLALLPARVAGSVLGGFGVLGMLLAGIGLYGVMAYAVSQRTRELGIRMALGAARADLVRMVVREGMRLTLLGIGIGLVLAAAAGRLTQGLLYGITGTDAITFAGVSGVLAAVALLACWLPARRASGVDPLVALRTE